MRTIELKFHSCNYLKKYCTYNTLKDMACVLYTHCWFVTNYAKSCVTSDVPPVHNAETILQQFTDKKWEFFVKNE